MIYLAQTDTTAGFLSKNLQELNKIKHRNENQPCLITVAKFSELKKLTRVPEKFKNFVRKSKKTTILYPNKKAIRVVKNCAHCDFLYKHGWMYSTSANIHGKNFDIDYAKSVSDIIVDSEFFESTPSKIYKISNTCTKKIR